ncbi:MAG: hypothetical protein M3P45_01340 [Acidobacteriota bacterium]|nr:hypothetical protein [Acidobacteriota bacterium]
MGRLMRKLGIRVLANSEVDILKDGDLDYAYEFLAQMAVMVCSIHSFFNLERAAMHFDGSRLP